MRIGILASHPVQYQVPWFRALAKVCDVHVYFAHRLSEAEQGVGFGQAFAWDMDLLSGYSYSFLNNVASHPCVSRYNGCDTPEVYSIVEDGYFDAFIVMGWYLKCYRQAMAACRKNRIPVLVRGDSQLETPRPLLKRLALEVRQRWLLAKFSRFLSVGKRHSGYLQHFGVPPEKIFFAPHCIDNQWFAEKIGPR